ncbi:uncharacterized protein LOC132067197 [Lycium ferocissimum]|uniref:uncharacterized protein LOC132067197 n=1 Tax=Lycium ferocissimum TaxID=112874 RepID=UPI0028159F7C|nr:uncharacterized protein LOC132067197 [Lycium ferocissimum]
MVDAGFTGLRFTWCNTRGKPHRIWKRLDRVFFNNQWTDMFSRSDIEHLASTGSDHTPMLVKCSNSNFHGIKYFKFLQFWTEQPEFKNVSKEHIGNVFDLVKEWEIKMHNLETKYINDDLDDHREQAHKAQAEYTKWLKFDESILKQKANIRWLEEGDANTKYFHAIINEKRRRLNIQRIINSEGQWINGDEQIFEEAVNHFNLLFHEDNDPDLQYIDCLDQVITQHDNDILCAMPQESEIRDAGFALSPSSALEMLVLP